MLSTGQYLLLCMPFLMMTGLMAPKGRKKDADDEEVENKPNKRLRERKVPEPEPARDITTVKVERDAKGKLPPIPEDELNRLNSRLRCLSSSGDPQPLKDFLAKTRDEKRTFFWEKYRFDHNIIYVKREEKKESGETISSGTLEGRMTKYMIAQLNGVLPGTKNYEEYCDDLVSNLPAWDHPNEKLAAKGEKVYDYCHEKLKDTSSFDNKSSTLMGKIDIDAKSHGQALADLGISTTSASSTEGAVTIEPWKNDWLAAVREAKEKILNAAQKIFQDADRLLYNLKLDPDNKIHEAVVEELKMKNDKFDCLTKAYGETLVLLNSQANNEESSKTSRETLEKDSASMDVHIKTHKTYVSKVKNFTA